MRGWIRSEKQTSASTTEGVVNQKGTVSGGGCALNPPHFPTGSVGGAGLGTLGLALGILGGLGTAALLIGVIMWRRWRRREVER